MIKRDLNLKAKLLIYYSLLLEDYPHVWPRALDSDLKNEMLDTSCGNKHPPNCFWVLHYSEMDFGGAQRAHIEKTQLRWFRHLIR